MQGTDAEVKKNGRLPDTNDSFKRTAFFQKSIAEAPASWWRGAKAGASGMRDNFSRCFP